MWFPMILTRNWRRGSPLLAALLLVGCGGSSKAHTSDSTASTTSASTPGAAASLNELLSIPAIGRIYGRCKPGDRRWTIKFAATPQTATDTITYRVGSGRSRTVNSDPGRQALTWTLLPGQFTTHEPADPVSRFPPTTLKTTAPISLDITQGTEPHIYRVKIKFAVAAAIGDTTNCALISTSLTATTYYPGGQPPS